ncbi:N-acyl homoserine lactonase family protein [Parafrankia sp. FMc2]|uniref:N-acyl homoserine lactonase family protein n=1 Tax=Parafrankia sp. FMc2 TaxID=3233196 RepID=UPI0034D442FD
MISPGNATKMWALHGPTMTLDAGIVMVGGAGTVTIPDPCYVIRHPRGLVLFDTGLAPEAQQDPVAVYGDLALHVGMNFPEDQKLDNQLAAIGFGLRDITHVVCSHTHLDHTGGLHLFPHAKFYAGAGDLRYAFWPDALDAGLYRRHDLEATRGFDWTHVHSDLDLFGDGSIVILHMPGHTPGNLSLLVRLTGTTFLLTADTVHLRASLDNIVPAPADYNSYDAKRSIERLAHLRDSLDATVWIGHDPEDAKDFSFAPYAYE